MKRLTLVLPLAVAFGLAAHAAPQVDVVASGLANPRGLAFAPDRTLWVAEAGTGGEGACIDASSGQHVCYGETGALTRVDPAGASAAVRVVTGLPSLAARGGFGATGPVDVSFQGKGGAFVVIGLGAEPGKRDGIGAKSDLFGSVIQISAGGTWKKVGDVAAHEAANNPDGGNVDTNPYGILATPSARVVADAGANALVEVGANGATRTLAVLPARLVTLPSPPFPPNVQIPMQAVPTATAQGPGGWLYVSQLTGFPFPIGGARIYRVPPGGGDPEIVADDFTNVVDLAFDGAGNLLVLEIGHGLGAEPLPLAPPGTLWRVAPDGTRTVVLGGLFYPAGVAVDRDGSIYVTNNGILPGGGEVLRIRE